MKWTLAMLVVLATMLIAPGASAGATHIPRNVIFDGTVSASDGWLIFSGHVESPDHRCTWAGSMQLVVDGHVADDLDSISSQGAWAMRLQHPEAVDESLEARILASKFGRKGHRKVCDADTVSIPLS